MRGFRTLSLLACSVCLSGAGAQQSPTEHAKSILDAAIAALKGVNAASYQVKFSMVSDGKAQVYVSQVLAANKPPRYLSKSTGSPDEYRSVGVRDANEQRASSNGEVQSLPVPVKGAFGPIAVMSESDVAAAGTWSYLIDPAFLAKIEGSGQYMYVGTDTIDGMPVDVVSFVRESTIGQNQEKIIKLCTAWFSQQTHLPAAINEATLARGRYTASTPRFVLSNVVLNPAVPKDAFDLHPTASDSSGPTAQPLPEKASKKWDGIQLADFDLKDMDNHAIKLSDYKGKPTLITFFASWCGPCMAELKALSTMPEVVSHKIQIVAIGVQDSRQNLVKFVGAHKDYPFTFVTDSDLDVPSTAILAYFQITSIPVSLTVSPDWKVIDFDGHGFAEGSGPELEKRLQKAIG